MRILGVTLGLACALAGVAAADPADDLRARGEQLAKDGRFSEAITAFKQSNVTKPRASNSCLIGLAYTRRELWPQAEIMIDRCKREASAADPTPSWLPELEQTLAARLKTVGVAPVEILVSPPEAKVELTVSSFAPDEQFAPRTIHLPPGSHVVSAVAPGYAPAQQTLAITDATPQRVLIELEALPAAKPPVQPAVWPNEPPASHSIVPVVVMGTGAALIATGIVYHLTAFRTAAKHLSDATDPSSPRPDEFDQWSHRFDVRRDWLIGFYAAGVITGGIGAYLQLTTKQTESLPHVSVVPTTGGALVTLGWP